MQKLTALIALALLLSAPASALAAEHDPLAEVFTEESAVEEATTPAEGEGETTVAQLSDVTGVIAASTSATSVNVSWDAVEGADAYTIYYGTESVAVDGSEYEFEELVENATTFALTELTAGATYYFAVAAEDTTGAELGSQNYSRETSITLAAAEVVEAPAESAVAESADLMAASVVEPTPDTAALASSGPATNVALLLALFASGYIWLRRGATQV